MVQVSIKDYGKKLWKVVAHAGEFDTALRATIFGALAGKLLRTTLIISDNDIDASEVLQALEGELCEGVQIPRLKNWEGEKVKDEDGRSPVVTAQDGVAAKPTSPGEAVGVDWGKQPDNIPISL